MKPRRFSADASVAAAACATTTMIAHAAARGIKLEEVESTIEGDIDVRGFLGLSPEVKKGYSGIRLTSKLKSDAPTEQLRDRANADRNRCEKELTLTVPPSAEPPQHDLCCYTAPEGIAHIIASLCRVARSLCIRSALASRNLIPALKILLGLNGL